jgi:thiol-disulfide isomerase/thioredoxin
MTGNRSIRLSLLTLLLPALLATTAAMAADDEPATLARSAGKPVIADFGLGFCVQCKKQRATLEEVRKAFGDKIIVRMVNVSKEGRLVERYKVEMIPTLVFFDASGQVTFRKVGPLGFKEISGQLSRMGVKE